MIEFHLEQRTGVAPYMQLVQQVKRALRLGLLQPGDQLPTVREVVTMIAINPNTVFKAYRELERDGLVESRPGLGTFVRTQLRVPDRESLERVRVSLQQWLEQAAGVGLDDESVVDLLMDTLQKRRAALS
ncbi:GntR family transcriptional regulator [Ktedonobacter sp. SOSP1-85]|uniref:GntR family transcriptional regulator n=1 Tax=Ktedonobacter sp. SOSP1-85 TaxID=2778367 RepID=UPI001916958D|nr:GntR family transcriptional regulator [Ktedonobacter sp. SOSP1-85]GHO80756.1 GntR family transcriptional regulator [Ktedonobacter sp. SOSP1-85]